MIVEFKTGWLARDLIFTFGEERWIFSADKPEYAEEFVAKDSEHRPARVVQILYVLAEPAGVPT